MHLITNYNAPIILQLKETPGRVDDPLPPHGDRRVVVLKEEIDGIVLGYERYTQIPLIKKLFCCLCCASSNTESVVDFYRKFLSKDLKNEKILSQIYRLAKVDLDALQRNKLPLLVKHVNVLSAAKNRWLEAEEVAKKKRAHQRFYRYFQEAMAAVNIPSPAAKKVVPLKMDFNGARLKSYLTSFGLRDAQGHPANEALLNQIVRAVQDDISTEILLKAAAIACVKLKCTVRIPPAPSIPAVRQPALPVAPVLPPPPAAAGLALPSVNATPAFVARRALPADEEARGSPTTL